MGRDGTQNQGSLAIGLFLPRAIVLIPLTLLIVLGASFVLLWFNRIVAHPLWVIGLLLIMLTLLFIGYGLCAAHLGAPFTLVDAPARRNITQNEPRRDCVFWVAF